MSQITEPIDTAHDRIKLPFTFDVEKMKEEVSQFKLEEFIYYNVVPLRAPAHTVDTTLPPPPPAEDYADGSWTEWMDTKELISSPYLLSIVDMFREKTKVTLVRILRLASGQMVNEHTDPTLGLQIHKSVIRLTIPIISNENTEFFLNGSIVPMQPGECWYLRLTDPHKVLNRSSGDRINMTIDMIPNEWVQQQILENDK
ncbi:MAG TPA: aspartyl beta-hydroxylase [Cryomorphaceae bacterium]|nr:aspartyl beta-hydroxylase [Owenweeksia sp.]MBG00326.1 aspartyl beta-hydroxylase [Owenweeksia sp.]HAD98444.1 aspartyl beta-hydroxylase [Cryomorphaceae bacterium]HBF20710.1 aspartyl beta-hydroxylase [Cryomorphaceae bacterium]HCQ16360.1 aspartyl beta-hydroxylase [Cryomorphaceae bacterium]|tara:strand:+ start:145 stop:744 length:600 start_codon:yes stop_codon:yes gene_type:complete